MVKHTNSNVLRYGYALAFVLLAFACILTIGVRFQKGLTKFSSDILAVVPSAAQFESPSLKDAKNTIQQRSSSQLVFSSNNKLAIEALTNALKSKSSFTYIAPPDIALDEVVDFSSRYPGSLMASNYHSKFSKPSELLHYPLAELHKPASTLSANSL